MPHRWSAASSAEHNPQAIERRLSAQRSHSYVGDAVLGGIDTGERIP